MTARHQIEFGTATLFGLAAAMGVFIAFYGNNTPKIQKTFALPIVQGIDVPTPTPTSEPTPAVETFSQPAPNGAKKVTMKVSTNKDATKTYSFTTSDGDDSNQKSIYSVTLPPEENMSLPFNSWSPDDKYLFLTHHTAAVNEALVFRGDGTPMTELDQHYEVYATFKAKNITNTYNETTGWASETLLIVNTTTPGGTVQSYWFEVPSKAIIPLSTQFYD